MDISQGRGGAREEFPGATQPVNKAMLNIVPYKGQLSDEEDHSQLVNCPTQPTCIAHCDLCISQLWFITNPQ